MKILFDGVARRVHTHEHEVGDLTWVDANRLGGSLVELKLSGDFFMEAHFSTKELLEWLEHYIAADPEKAVETLAKYHSKSIVALHRSSRDD